MTGYRKTKKESIFYVNDPGYSENSYFENEVVQAAVYKRPACPSKKSLYALNTVENISPNEILMAFLRA